MTGGRRCRHSRHQQVRLNPGEPWAGAVRSVAAAIADGRARPVVEVSDAGDVPGGGPGGDTGGSSVALVANDAFAVALAVNTRFAVALFGPRTSQ
jgi:hypothetical protein